MMNKDQASYSSKSSWRGICLFSVIFLTNQLIIITELRKDKERGTCSTLPVSGSQIMEGSIWEAKLKQSARTLSGHHEDATLVLG